MNSAERILAKAVVGSGLDSEHWSKIQAGLRDRAFFSATVTDSNIIHGARELVSQVAAGKLSESEYRLAMRKYLERTGYVEGVDENGGIKDLTSRARLDVIVKTNVGQARGYMQHIEGTTAGALAAFPAYELVRVRQREEPRDWVTRWKKAGGKLYNGRMIALKTSPVWSRISAFGNPFPPFDFGSGMGVDDVSADECRELGVPLKKQRTKVPDLNGSLQSAVKAPAGSSARKALEMVFGDQVVFEGDIAKWRPNLIGDVLAGRRDSASIGTASNALLAQIPGAFNRPIAGAELKLTPEFLKSQKVAKQDFDLIPTCWRTPDAVRPIRGGYALDVETYDGGRLTLAVKEDGTPISFERL